MASEVINKSDLDKIFEEQKKYYNLIKLELEIFNLENQYNKKRVENEEILNSTSWKVMAPMRMVGSAFKGITGRRVRR